jgi:hypothetical protein
VGGMLNILNSQTENKLIIFGDSGNSTVQLFLEMLAKNRYENPIYLISEKMKIKKVYRVTKISILTNGICEFIHKLISKLSKKYSSTIFSKNITEIVFNKLSSNCCISYIEDLKCDFAISMTNDYIPMSVRNCFTKGVWNAHPGANPEYRGFNAAERMLNDGFIPQVTVHLIDEGIDSGPILFAKSLEVNSLNSREQINQSIRKIQAELLLDTYRILISNRKIHLLNPLSIESNIRHSPKYRHIMKDNYSNLDFIKYTRIINLLENINKC